MNAAGGFLLKCCQKRRNQRENAGGYAHADGMLIMDGKILMHGHKLAHRHLDAVVVFAPGIRNHQAMVGHLHKANAQLVFQGGDAFAEALRRNEKSLCAVCQTAGFTKIDKIQ